MHQFTKSRQLPCSIGAQPVISYDINVTTFNVRGLRDAVKRRTLFRYFHVHYPLSVMMLQETHSCRNDEQYWKAEWGGNAVFSHGTNRQNGTAIMFPRQFKGVIGSIDKDVVGRTCAVNVKFDSASVWLVCAYAPAANSQQEKVTYLNELQNLLQQRCTNVLLGGDFNISLDTRVSDSSRIRCSASRSRLSRMIDGLGLTDVWRHKHPKAQRFTWRRKNSAQKSRIDYLFISEWLLNNNIVSRCEISPGILSDHSFVTVDLRVADSVRGPGLWRFNNCLLDNSEFVSAVKFEIEKATQGIEAYENIDCKGTHINLLLCNIRSTSMRMSKQIAAAQRREETELVKRLAELEDRLSQTPCADIEQEVTCLKAEVEEFELRRAKVAMLQSRSKWMELGEKPSGYFLQLQRHQSAQKAIHMLQLSDGRIINTKDEIMNACVSHLSRIYTKKNICEATIDDFLSTVHCPQLSNDDMRSCEGVFTTDECRAALKLMAKNKVPGISGFTAEFFEYFWDSLGPLAVQYFNDAAEHGLHVSQRRGVIILLPKKGDQKMLKNKRPICLLDVLYKIIAKVIAIRMARVIDLLISSDQTGSLPGRYIGENIRLITDVIEYCQTDQTSGILMAMDYRNAFDAVEHNFLFKTLEKFNFGPDIVRYVKLLYDCNELTILNNGHTSKWFQPSRGVLQGLPVSGILFALAVEMMAIKLRSDENVTGIVLSNIEIKLSQYADDATIFVKDERSALSALDVMNRFEQASGLELNLDKCHFMWLGDKAQSDDTICGKRPSQKVKIIGVTFSSSGDVMDDNVKPVVSKIEKTLNCWNQRNLTVKGRITVAKSLAVSQLVYLAASIDITQAELCMIQSLIQKFIWRGRPPKVAQKVIIQSIDDGGLGSPHVPTLYKALRLSWLNRIWNKPDAIWHKLLQNRIGSLTVQDLIRSRLSNDMIEKLAISPFYRALLRWIQPYKQQPVDVESVAKEIIWNNKYVRIGGKPAFYKKSYCAGIRMVGDIYDLNGCPLSLAAINRDFPNHGLSFLEHYGLLKSIPDEWKLIMRRSINRRRLNTDADEFNLKVGDAFVAMKDIRVKTFCKMLIPNVIPSAWRRWEADNFRGIDWTKVCKIPYECCFSTKLQSVQYRVLHRFIPTQKFLHHRRIVKSPNCVNCGELDTLVHFLFNCREVRQLWNSVRQYLNDRMRGRYQHISPRDVIFGKIRGHTMFNVVIIVCKLYIYQIKMQGRNDMNMRGFMYLLRSHFAAERLSARNRGQLERHNIKWHPLLNGDGTMALA